MTFLYVPNATSNPSDNKLRDHCIFNLIPTGSGLAAFNFNVNLLKCNE